MGEGNNERSDVAIRKYYINDLNYKNIYIFDYEINDSHTKTLYLTEEQFEIIRNIEIPNKLNDKLFRLPWDYIWGRIYEVLPELFEE